MRARISGMFAWPWSWWARAPARLPDEVREEAGVREPWNGVPKPILNAHRTQTMSTIAKVTNVSIMLLMDHRFCMTPP